VAVARLICSHLPLGDTPLWLGFKKAGNADPAAALAALTQERRIQSIPASTVPDPVRRMSA